MLASTCRSISMTLVGLNNLDYCVNLLSEARYPTITLNLSPCLCRQSFQSSVVVSFSRLAQISTIRLSSQGDRHSVRIHLPEWDIMADYE